MNITTTYTNNLSGIWDNFVTVVGIPWLKVHRYIKKLFKFYSGLNESRLSADGFARKTY